MSDDFVLIDFAVAARPPIHIVSAIGRLRLAEARAARDRARAKAAGAGFLSRLFRSGGTGTPGLAELMIQPDGTLPPAPLSRPTMAPPADDAGGGGALRLTAPVGSAGMTLIEFLSGDGETSGFCERLSQQLGGDEIFYFRHSGNSHPGAFFAFHVYRNGRATRRAASISAAGTAPEADWIGIDAGMPHPVEVDSLPPPGIPDFEVMTPMRQGSILEALGIDPEALFEPPSGDMMVLELSTDPGGAPLSEAEMILSHRLRRPRPPLRALQGGAVKPEAPQDVTPEPPGVTAPPPEASDLAAPAPAAPPPAPSAATANRRTPDQRDLSRPPWEQQTPAPSWEEEVTSILVAAVEAALPPEEQVAWLDMLTAHLEAGRLDEALEEATAVISAGHRSDIVRASAARRLAELFGRQP
ncbi:hypothetical protein [Tropicimonas sp. IMCC34043]|uniref:hypothetical protein n=1 Tax=Tropicimonas sp. IMCC34043 TaxID=2248760 RepID=UPI000E25F205|nr:hypothetical protein [Tropicimonas sp. IMCC34043]